LVPWKSRGAALLALTGDIEFNRDIRTRAINLGLHLNEFGLWRWQSNGSEEAEVETATEKAPEKGYWELVKADTEEEILRELGLDFVEPTKRNFSNVVGKQTKKKATTRKSRD
jgi:DNA polymerase beta